MTVSHIEMLMCTYNVYTVKPALRATSVKPALVATKAGITVT